MHKKTRYVKERSYMHPKLKLIAEQLPFIQQTFPEDAALVLYDTEKVIFYLPGEKMDVGVELGRLLEESKQGVGYKAFVLKKKVREERSYETGLSMIATGIPIFDQNEIIGVLTIAMSNERVNSLRKATEQLNLVVQDLSTATTGIAKGAEENTEQLQFLSEKSKSVTNDLEEIHQVLHFVSDIATKSHMLGLNAAIEAARSGEHGRGFTVVANEIRKMAENSKASVEQIFKQLTKIENEIISMNEIIQTIANNSQKYLANVEEFYSTFETINATSTELKKQASI